MPRALSVLSLIAVVVTASVPSLQGAVLPESAQTRRAAAAQARPVVSDQDWCRDTDRYDRDRETFCEVRELTEGKPGVFEILDNANGSISVTGTSRRDVQVRARVATSAGTASEARSLAADVRVTLEGGRVRASGPTMRRGSSWWVSYRVEVPSSQDLTLDTSNGSVDVSGVRGRIDVGSSNGSLRLTDLGGRVDARTSNGSVHVTLNGSSWDGDGLRVTTSNGSARVDLPDRYNARLIVGTHNGSLSLDVPITVQGNLSRLNRGIDTTLGSGGPPVEVRSSNGGIRVGRR